MDLIVKKLPNQNDDDDDDTNENENEDEEQKNSGINSNFEHHRLRCSNYPPRAAKASVTALGAGKLSAS